MVRNWAEAGLGVVVRSEWDAGPCVKRGALQRILTGFEFEGADVLALVPTRRGISAWVSRFVEFLRAGFHKPPWR